MRPGGRTAFLTIHPAEGLSAGQRRRASRYGPPAVGSRPHRELLEKAGFIEITETDCTAEFAGVTRAWIDQWESHRAELEAMWGAAEVDDRQRGRKAYLRVVDAGILRRSLFTARRPQVSPRSTSG
ncbi:MAG: hypothetical protein NVS3B1_25960 [Marmoricola sp.]